MENRPIGKDKSIFLLNKTNTNTKSIKIKIK